MFSYAGVNLSEPNESVGINIAGWISANIHPERLFPLAYKSWPESFGNGPVLNQSPEHDRAARINSLFWPRGASRFARGHFVVSGSQLKAIRAVTTRAGVLSAAPFVFSDAVGSITTSLWMLPSIPLSKALTGSEMYLLTLVDDRYWWWGQALDLAVTVGVTTWANLYAAIGTNLGISIAVDPVSANYGTPTADYNTGARPLPMIFDAIAFSVGQRVVRSLTGSVRTQNVATAVAAVTANLTLPANSYAGGQMDFNPRV
jgi:hypothetical protein